jgi:hypothetical protein
MATGCCSLSHWRELPDINVMAPKFMCIIFKNSVRAAKKTPHFTISKIN